MLTDTGLAVRSIAENTGLLKHKLYKIKVPTKPVPPTVIKKYATGKGNANKELMYEAFCAELLTPSNLKTRLTPKSKKIRMLLKKYQKNFAKKNHVCIEGRDIGSVICPNADIKLFFKCNLEVRAKRRWNEYKKNNSKITLGEVKKALKIRDYSDINRKHSPLRVPKDSIVIDTSKINKKQVLDKISRIVEKKLFLKYGRNYKAR